MTESNDDSESGQPPRSSRLAPEALVGLGKLRECVAAAKNLEHLIASRDIGPKVLKQVVPDIASELEPFSQAVEDVYTYVRGQLNLPEESLAGLLGTARATSENLVAVLRAESKAQFNARQRLTVERSIRSSLPPLSATLCQIELLVEATSQIPVPMSVGELMSSAPDVGSNRPKRVLTLTGELEELSVSIPARIGIGCLSMVASSLEARGRPWGELQAHRKDGRVEFTFTNVTEPDGRRAEIPICPDAPHSMDAVAAALSRFDGRLDANRAGFSLPEH